MASRRSQVINENREDQDDPLFEEASSPDASPSKAFVGSENDAPKTASFTPHTSNYTSVIAENTTSLLLGLVNGDQAELHNKERCLASPSMDT